MDERDCSSLLGCADLVRPVKALRIYGVCKGELDLVALSILMPEVTVLDVTTADKALSRCAAMAGFKWTKVETLRLRNPRLESIQGILAAIAVGNLRIHYPFPVKMLSRAEMEWVSTKRCSCTFIAMYPAMAGGYIGLKALLGWSARVYL
jgi:hypothetical protein